jgi:hypothetical protein
VCQSKKFIMDCIGYVLLTKHQDLLAVLARV